MYQNSKSFVCVLDEKHTAEIQALRLKIQQAREKRFCDIALTELFNDIVLSNCKSVENFKVNNS
jgi:hypothetical protein